MITLIKNADVFAPQNLGVCDILLSDGKIAAIESQIDIDSPFVDTIDASGMVAIPGFVDTLVHFSGGGGEGGFHTRTPQMSLTDATLAGVTTVIGALGTDATTRSHADLLAKAHALQNEGLTTYCYTGSYQVPPRTVTGSVTDDIVLIDKIIGIGEVAIADHRGSQVSDAELARIAADAKVGGMLAGKGGIVSVHVGASDSQLNQLKSVVDNYDVRPSQFYPTHVNRNQALLDDGISWAKQGGFIDMTTSTNENFISQGEIPASLAVSRCLTAGVPASHVTMSSDGNASLPVFDDDGVLIGLEVGKVGSLLGSFIELVNTHNVALENAVRVVSTTPASILQLRTKGRLKPEFDADILLFEASNMSLNSVFARGKRVVKDKTPTVYGTFEKNDN